MTYNRTDCGTHAGSRTIVDTPARTARMTFLATGPATPGTPTTTGRPRHVGTLSGYALVWNVLSVDRGGYKVRLLKDSARFAPTVLALWHHEWAEPLGCNTNGTLRITPDSYGVRVEIDLPDTSRGRDAATLVGRGDVRGMSFEMTDWTENQKTEGGQSVVEISDYPVTEVTVTPNPAFLHATVGVKEAGATMAANRFPARTAQSLLLERYRFDLLRIPGECQPAAPAVRAAPTSRHIVTGAGVRPTRSVF